MYEYTCMVLQITDGMAMGKLHKDIATHIVHSVEDEAKSDQQVIKV